ncbi:PfkB family carbohydrate kinase [Bradyrhizobium sp. SZCCHNS1054]|uniref:PfkB family carbohydrate kinase n=1 Tax=Bradyrhizobium sp. SZCCHNS1054 TaxID=3057301 RepID=UPI002916BE87|nr:PfkB family carbohydrate kinase [Bradyrhizobium sp. SZCCHNS1054]
MDDFPAEEVSSPRSTRSKHRGKRTVAFVSGNFNVVHPGHLRLLRFAAEQASTLVVGVNADCTPGANLCQEVRLENVRSIGFVDEAVPLEGSAGEFISRVKPDIVVKGKEYEQRFNPEQAAVDAYGGQLVFSSGEMRFTSLSLIERDYVDTDTSTIRKPSGFASRHGFEIPELKSLLGRLAGMRVLVIGDLIIDEYITCDAIGMSQEDPTIVVTPLLSKTFVGGAGGVAAHARGLGAEVQYFTIVGNDEQATFAADELSRQGIECYCFTDSTRPTTRKQRYRALNKTLLRVNFLRHHAASIEVQQRILSSIEHELKACDLVLFSCFNYGCLPQPLVDAIAAKAQAANIMLAADSQASSQIGDVSRFRNMGLITPTEREARLALGDFEAGLSSIAERLLAKCSAKHLIITLGAEGILINTIADHSLLTDRLPAFNLSPKDVAGAGDSLFTSTAMALRVGADIWESSYLGALAAALQVSRVGNGPLTTSDLIAEIDGTMIDQD